MTFLDHALAGAPRDPLPLTPAELASLETAERRSNREIAHAVLAARDAGLPRYQFRLSGCSVSGSGPVNEGRVAWAVAFRPLLAVLLVPVGLVALVVAIEFGVMR